jgi:hypothetical protein
MTAQPETMVTGFKRQFCVPPKPTSSAAKSGKDLKRIKRFDISDMQKDADGSNSRYDVNGIGGANFEEDGAVALMRQLTMQVRLGSERFAREVQHQDNDNFGDKYVVSFEANETKKIRRFLARHGFVCVRTLDRQVCDDAVRAIVTSIAEQAGEGVEPWRWESYINRHMPEGFSTGVFEGASLVDWTEAGGRLESGSNKAEENFDLAMPQAVVDSYDFAQLSDEQLLRKLPLRVDRCTHLEPLWTARTDPNLYRTFANLLQTSQLYTNVGQVHFMRPKRARPSELNEDWRSHIKTTFWDRPPPADEFGGFYGLQVLVDAPEEVGGLELVPGFHQVYGDWLRLQQNNINNSSGAAIASIRHPRKQSKQNMHKAYYNKKSESGGGAHSGRVLLPKKQYADRLVNGNMCRIAVRAGTVIIVDRRLPLRTYANNSVDRPFCAMEVSMVPHLLDPLLDNTARRLRRVAYESGVRFTSLPALTGHFASTWTRWRREVPEQCAAERYQCAQLSVLGECLLGVCGYSAKMLSNFDLPHYDDIVTAQSNTFESFRISRADFQHFMQREVGDNF